MTALFISRLLKIKHRLVDKMIQIVFTVADTHYCEDVHSSERFSYGCRWKNTHFFLETKQEH
jgi:hypothetical protein